MSDLRSEESADTEEINKKRLKNTNTKLNDSIS